MEDYLPNLDSMCEVVLSEDPPAQQDLPPVPMFDLQAPHINLLPPPISPALKEPPPLVLAHPKTPLVFPANNPFSPILLSNQPTVLHDSISFPIKISNYPPCTKVYVKADYSIKNLQKPSEEEIKYYNLHFYDVSKVNYCRLHCTICNVHLGSNVQLMNSIKVHKMLGVLVCKKCCDFYGDGKFPKDARDNSEIFCRWCGQGGSQVCCSFCPKVFCKKCVRRNFSTKYLKEIEAVDDWACFCCAPQPLWPLRAVCRALHVYLNKNANSKKFEDLATCCGQSKSRMVYTGPPKLERPLAPKLPVANKMKILSSPNILSKPKSTASFSPRPPLPVLHPAPSTSVPSKPAKKKSLRVPEIVVDHSVQSSMLLRFNMPADEEQYFHLTIEGNCLTMPKNITKPNSLQGQSLQHMFKLTKALFNRLKSLNTKFNENSSETDQQQTMKVLSDVIKFKKLLGDVENDIKLNLHNNRLMEDGIQVINDDDDGSNFKWTYQADMKDFEVEDSDVEIIDDEEDVVRTVTNGNEDDAKTVTDDSDDNDSVKTRAAMRRKGKEVGEILELPLKKLKCETTPKEKRSTPGPGGRPKKKPSPFLNRKKPDEKLGETPEKKVEEEIGDAGSKNSSIADTDGDESIKMEDESSVEEVNTSGEPEEVKNTKEDGEHNTESANNTKVDVSETSDTVENGKDVEEPSSRIENEKDVEEPSSRDENEKDVEEPSSRNENEKDVVESSGHDVTNNGQDLSGKDEDNVQINKELVKNVNEEESENLGGSVEDVDKVLEESPLQSD